MTHESVRGETLPADHITKTPNVIDKEGAQDDHADISQGVSADVSTPYERPPKGITQTQRETLPYEPSIAAGPYSLDHVAPLDPTTFPNQGTKKTPVTIPNVLHLLKSYGISVRYDVVKKRLLIQVPGLAGTAENADNVAMAQIVSLATLNKISAGRVPEYVAAVGDRNQVNPVAQWIKSKTWDSKDRLQALCDTLVTQEGYPWPLKQLLLHRWLISTVAAVLKPSGFRARGVLTLQGPQSIGKTAWISALVPDPILREMAIKLDHHLDASNKDSLITAISHWIVEIGELDSSFKKDVARLKGFLTGDKDKVRRPYGRTDSEYPRRTVFCATVNDANFLVDPTGNTRWWTIPVTKINFNHDIDMQQLFAQIAIDFENGDPWWLTHAEEACLEEFNAQHRSISALRERVLSAVDTDRGKEANLPAMTPTELLQEIGINNPTNAQCKECAAILREFFGESKRIKGLNKWRIPLMQNKHSKPHTPKEKFESIQNEDF